MVLDRKPSGTYSSCGTDPNTLVQIGPSCGDIDGRYGSAIEADEGNVE